jgi:MoaA/NifB/PqqE/SkfB family radical SAM enzyme
MSEDTFARLSDQLQEFPLQTLRVIGGGEPTTHPRFGEFAVKLKNSAAVRILTTNGQLFSKKYVNETATSFDIVEISVDGKDADEYERYRLGGSFDTLLKGTELLRSAATDLKTGMRLHIRVMLRKADIDRKAELREFWMQHGDAVSFQNLRDRAGSDAELFQILPNSVNSFRQCEYPFKALGIAWNGDVPLCPTIEERLKVSDGGLLLGNINNESLLDIWRKPLLRQYRDGHRRSNASDAPLCLGCDEVWGKVNGGNQRG